VARSFQTWFLLVANVAATIGASFAAAVHFGVAWALSVSPAVFFAIMVGGMFLGVVVSYYYLFLAFRSYRWRGRAAWILAFACTGPLAAFAAWYLLVLREPPHRLEHAAQR
jgi:cation transporter-like permease